MGYGFACSSDLTWYEKLGMLSLWLTFGGLLPFIPGLIVAGVVGLATKLGAKVDWLMWVGVVLMIPSGLGAFGYLVFEIAAGVAEGAQRAVSYLQVFRSKLQSGG